MHQIKAEKYFPFVCWHDLSPSFTDKNNGITELEMTPWVMWSSPQKLPLGSSDRESYQGLWQGFITPHAAVLTLTVQGLEPWIFRLRVWGPIDWTI